ncbi:MULTISPECIES: prepilin-type N-terminal cleavage/methylation domain-containing protein [Cellulomonas]|uniref:prepilin-type N-terminal cleavage/methylation domain-containing protein n=1 Tax=Cellulomonas TaxID=1707 RepID=UPI00069BFEDD|nr:MULTISPECIES: prepilin-type N-terminal cleavage/methylation domain-containing protein [Cellulomonas]
MSRAPAVGDRGFTLVEVVVVVVVLGVLAAIAVPVLLAHRADAYAASVQADLRSVAVAVEAASSGPGVLDVARLEDQVVLSPRNVVEVVADGERWCVRGWHGAAGSATRWVLDRDGLGSDDARCAGPAVVTL